MTIDIRQIPTTTHGRVIVRQGPPGATRGVLAGFHGYMENAEIQMERLSAIPGAEAWTLVSIQGLHRLYRGRSEVVVASWMTRQDRETAIADNIAYVDTALDGVAAEGVPLVCAGFSQGVAMAFRSAVRGRRAAAGVIAVGGDVPPELLRDPRAAFPPVLLSRGQRDEWYTQAKLDRDVAALTGRAVPVRASTWDGGHEWHAAVADAAAAFLRSLTPRL